MAAESSFKLRPSSVVLSVGVFTFNCVTQVYIDTERLRVLLRKLVCRKQKSSDKSAFKVHVSCSFGHKTVVFGIISI